MYVDIMKALFIGNLMMSIYYLGSGRQVDEEIERHVLDYIFM